MELKKIQKITLFDDVIHQIKDLIQKGHWKPGDQLPPERDLSTQLGVSRNTLREATKALKLIGVLKVKQGGGTYIHDQLNVSLISHSFDFLSFNEIHEILQVLEARKVMEVALAAMAAERADCKNLKAMRSYIRLMEKNIKNPEECSKFDAKFHLALAEASGNTILFGMLKALRVPLIRVMERTIYLEQAPKFVLEDHAQIFRAVEAGDAVMAESTMRHHLEAIEAEVLTTVKPARKSVEPTEQDAALS